MPHGLFASFSYPSPRPETAQTNRPSSARPIHWALAGVLFLEAVAGAGLGFVARLFDRAAAPARESPTPPRGSASWRSSARPSRRSRSVSPSTPASAPTPGSSLDGHSSPSAPESDSPSDHRWDLLHDKPTTQPAPRRCAVPSVRFVRVTLFFG